MNQPKICIVPINFYHYWHDYGRCLCCRQEIRHEMHLYNHYKKYHWDFRLVVRYFAWFRFFQQWIEVSLSEYIRYKRLKQPTAIARGTNVI